jgi:phosphoglycolate phosphatase
VARVVFFDIDGTLIRTGGVSVKAFARAGETAFNVSNGVERMNFAGRTDTSLAREFFALHHIEPSPENFRHFFDSYVFWLDHLLPQYHGRVCPGVEQFIGELRQLRPSPLLGLLTGNIRLGAELKLRHYRLWEHFRTGAFGDDHEKRDHIAAIAKQRAARLLGKNDLRGDQVLVVGDTPFDVQCGRAIGAKVLTVTTGGATREQLASHQPDWLVNDLREIKAAEIWR